MKSLFFLTCLFCVSSAVLGQTSKAKFLAIKREQAKKQTTFIQRQNFLVDSVDIEKIYKLVNAFSEDLLQADFKALKKYNAGINKQYLSPISDIDFTVKHPKKGLDSLKNVLVAQTKELKKVQRSNFLLFYSKTETDIILKPANENEALQAVFFCSIDEKYSLYLVETKKGWKVSHLILSDKKCAYHIRNGNFYFNTELLKHFK